MIESYRTAIAAAAVKVNRGADSRAVGRADVFHEAVLPELLHHQICRLFVVAPRAKREFPVASWHRGRAGSRVRLFRFAIWLPPIFVVAVVVGLPVGGDAVEFLYVVTPSQKW